MCGSSNLRCGSCLAKWTGKAWEDTYKCILPLKSWTLVLNKKYQLCVEGQCDINVNISLCIPIGNRLSSFWVTNEHTLVKLRGALNAKDVPKYIVEKFTHGIPVEWREIAGKWVDYTRQGGPDTFIWEQEDSLASSDLSFFSPKRRNQSAGRAAATAAKDKSSQKAATGTWKEKEYQSETDSVLKSSSEQPATSLAWNCPWLPAHKVQAINQWIDCSQDAPLPSLGTNSYVGQSDSAICMQNAISDRRHAREASVRGGDKGIVKNVGVATSTPTHPAKVALESLDFNVSSIAGISESTADGSRVLDGTFRKPKGPPTTSVQCSVSNATKTSEKNVSKKQSRSVASNSEVPGSHMVKMLCTKSKQKVQTQRLERWRPVLGVDGCLKVQGHLLLTGNLTAGQILTTNTVVQWGFRRIETCDGREYQLVGDPYEKMADDLKKLLLKPITCNEIKEKLLENQQLRENVTGCPYLAPPPAPMTINMTRSGRLCRPPAPFWLNRSDWGAEYEYFYDVEESYVNESSRTSRVTNKSTRNVSCTRQKGKAPKNLTPPAAASPSPSPPTPSDGLVSSKSTIAANQNADADGSFEKSLPMQRPYSSSEQLASDSDSSLHSPVRKSSRINERLLLGKYKDWKSSRSKSAGSQRDEDSGNTVENFNDNNSHMILERGVTNNLNKSRLSLENVTWKNSQNQMLPSLQLASETSVVHFSPSRIKVSYISPNNKAEQQLNIHSPSMKKKVTSSDSLNFSSRPVAHSPVNLSCCSNDSSPIIVQAQRSLCSPPIHHVSQIALRQHSLPSSSVLKSQSVSSSLHQDCSKTPSSPIRSISRRALGRKTLQLTEEEFDSFFDSLGKSQSVQAHSSKSADPKILSNSLTVGVKTHPATFFHNQTLINKKCSIGGEEQSSVSNKVSVTLVEDNELCSDKYQSPIKEARPMTPCRKPAERILSRNTSLREKCASDVTSSVNSVERRITRRMTILNNRVAKPEKKTPNSSSIMQSRTSIGKTPVRKISEGKMCNEKLSSVGISEEYSSDEEVTFINNSSKAVQTFSANISRNTPVVQLNRNSRQKEFCDKKTAVRSATCNDVRRNSRENIVNLKHSRASSPQKQTIKKLGRGMREPRVVLRRFDSPRNSERSSRISSKPPPKAQACSPQQRRDSSKRSKPSTSVKTNCKQTSGSPVKKKSLHNRSGSLKTGKNARKSDKRKVPTRKRSKTSGKQSRHVDAKDDTEDDVEDKASVCSNTTDISVGPSASVIFNMQATPPRRAPRTLKERKERDEQLIEMRKALEGREALTLDDDPMAHVIASHNFGTLPKEWCQHENILSKHRKRRRPSSSDGTASPRSSFDDGFGNWDATSSVATPQLLMRPPDPKQVQSYLQRQRALNSKPQRPTRLPRSERNLVLPQIDYAAAFQSVSSDSDAEYIDVNDDSE